MVQVAITDLATQDVYFYDCKEAGVSAWIACIPREGGSAGSLTHVASEVAPETTLAVSPVSGQFPHSSKSHLDLWFDPLNVLKGFDLDLKEHNFCCLPMPQKTVVT